MRGDWGFIAALSLIAAALFFNIIAARQCPLVYGMSESSNAQNEASSNKGPPPLTFVAGRPTNTLHDQPDKKGCFAGPFGIPSDGWVALFTLALFISTVLLWVSTERNLGHAESSSKRQLRAYVGIDSIVFECPSEQNMDGYTPVDRLLQPPIYRDYAAYTVKNFGETPARFVCIRAGIVEVPGRVMAALPNDFDIDKFLGQTSQMQREIIPRAYLNRGQAVVIKEVVHDVRILQRARRRESTIFQFGRIYYKDVYGRPWSTIFCYQWEPWHAMGERFYPYEQFNDEDQKEYPKTIDYAPLQHYPGVSR